MIEVHLIPSYVYVDGHELYVTYSGQNFTCKYCGEVGHKQIDCEKRKADFPPLQESVNASFEQSASQDLNNKEIVLAEKRQRLDSGGTSVQIAKASNVSDEPMNLSHNISIKSSIQPPSPNNAPIWNWTYAKIIPPARLVGLGCYGCMCSLSNRKQY